MSSDLSNKFINVQVAADRYGMSRRTLYYWMKGGRIEGRLNKFGGRMVHEADVQRELAKALQTPERTHIGQRMKRRAE